MAIRNILRIGDEFLLKKSRTVTDFNSRLDALLEDMAETMNDANGVGLAAPQVGILRRVVVIDVGEGIIELINPELINSEGSDEGVEGCLSMPGKYGYVARPHRATVRAQDRHGEWFEIEGEGLLARALCHEIDHLNGELFIDKVIEFVDDDDDDTSPEDTR